MPIALFWESNDKVYSCEETVSTDCREENGPVLDTKHMRHFCKVTMPYGTNHQREKRVNGSVFGTNPGGKKVAMTLSWASSR